MGHQASPDETLSAPSVDDVRSRNHSSAELDSVLAGGGAMGELIRAFDWSTTPVGPIPEWPQSLRTAVSILLDSLYPMLVLWGPDYIQFYNDAYRPVLGATKHPAALGQRARDCWPEIWDMIGPMFERARTLGQATWSEDLLFVLDRNGYLEETYFTFCYSAIRDEGNAPGGVLVTCVETTGRVLGERRLRCLRELAARAGQADTPESACALAASTLADHVADLPFALIYLLDDQVAHLVGTAGLEPDTQASPQTINPREDRRWPLEEVVQSGESVVMSDLGTRFSELPGGPWPESPDQAVVIPITRHGEERPSSVLVAGISRRRALDDDYRGFLDLVAAQIGTAVAGARAREQEHQRAEALAELDRAKTAFFSNVSHEFRTPLTLILGPLEEALAAPPERSLDAERPALESAHRNGLRLMRLVNALLDFSRIQAGRAEASFEPTDLAALTTELAGVFRSAIERAGLRLVVDCPELPTPVFVDREMWEKIVLNLLSNAFKFTFEGEIVVRLQAVGKQIRLEVSDTGTGIPPEEVPHVFERFHRIRETRSRSHEGTGIGLALVKELVGLHGGAIDVHSEIGTGTQFVVALPVGTAHLSADRIGTARTLGSTALEAAPYVEEALRWLPDLDDTPAGDTAAHSTDSVAPTSRATAPLPVVGEPGAAPAARVLVADDNADMRAYLRRLLSDRYAVRAVTNGADALAAVQTWRPDLVLADVMMPELDGIALVQALRADPRTRTLPVILLSARAGPESVAAGLQAGADDYLVKPFTASELLARVQAHVALDRLRSEARDALKAERDRLQAEVAARVQVEDALQHSHEQLRQALVQLQTLQAISEAAFTQLALPALLSHVLERITEAMGVDNTAILLLDEAENTLIVYHAVGPEEVQTGSMRVPVGQGVAGTIAATRLPLILDDLQTAEPVNPLLREQMASLLGVPLMVESRLLGVMHVDSATPRHFTEDELHLLQLVADRVALALDNARLYDVAQRARAAAEAERHHLHDIFMQAPAIICVVRGPEHVFEVANTRYLQTVGREAPDDFVGRPIREALPELVGQGYVELLDRVYSTGEPFAGTEMAVALNRGRDGTPEEILVDFVYQPYRKADGEVEGIMVHAVDVTEQVRARQRTEEMARQLQGERDRLAAEIGARVRAEHALRAGEERYRAIVETANEGVWLVDPQARTLFANARLAEMLGTTTDDVQDRTVLDFVYAEDLPLARERIGQNLAGVPEQFDFRFRRTDGTAVEVLACTSPVRAADGMVVGALGMFSDVTALRQLERAREEFLSSAAHDLKNPLTGIRGQAQLALRRLRRLDAPEPVPLSGPLAQIVQNTDAMVSLIDDLMDVTRQQMGAVLDLRREPADLVALVRDSIETHRAASSRIIYLEADEGELYAEVDPARIKRVIGNLLSNAIKYSAAERPIRVRLSRAEGNEGHEAVLEVRDEGIGIPAADVPHIFEHFYRAENVAGTVAGTGIGLSGARQIVEQHGGTISVESEEGVGSTFTVRLPGEALDAVALEAQTNGERR